MREIKFRCSSIGKLMTEPKTQKEGPLSVGAKTYIRELAAQAIFGVEFEVTSKAMEKGLIVEEDGIALLNRVRGLDLTKNSERRANEWIAGECDLYDAERRRGHDLKCSWSIATFPISETDCADKLYEWQMRGYMALWDAEEWEVDYALIDTPEHLIGWEPLQMHMVGHIPEHMRLTRWIVQRDRAKEEAIYEKVKHARAYYAEVIAEFDRTHSLPREKTPGEQEGEALGRMLSNPRWGVVLIPGEINSGKFRDDTDGVNGLDGSDAK
jgi:hypothetical protein